MSKSAYKLISNNKKAFYDYFIEEKFEAGIVLVGTEVKSIRNNSVSLKDSYVQIENGEVFIIGMNIPLYTNGNIFNHEPKRDRKLLLNKSEIRKLKQKIDVDGYTIVPTKIYINERNLVKIEIGIAKGKKNYDKRESIKNKDIQRQIERFK